ncbi:MAG: hypothetical protein A2498_08775 [Lentisphaerae bacterium RIFOXYC12_FULL_60_16]|nr:MAG: hypothetical protein A2498_08775 [Lentisphaerae bacterium RIFOXYC12_FULL_60_16]OGV81018.1 MAG: hypothetical protein A2340_07135 [Lentisphaerae bacterium RIFOXYB12_FULL_60_10]
MEMENKPKRKILLVDDDTSLLVTLSDFLRFEGYEVTTADSGEQGLKKLARFTPDLIILDMSMPGMGGVGFLKAVSNVDGKPKYPILVLTARANMAEFFANVDVEGFIAKPCDPNDLLMEVGRIIFLRSGADDEPSPGARVTRRKVLIGEDDRAVSEQLATVLVSEGYVVERVYSGPEVLEKSIVMRPDIIVLKLVLVNMNGDAVAQVLKEMPNTKTIPIVLYDDSNVQVASTKFTDSGTGIRKFIRGNSAIAVLEAVRTVLND